MPATVNVPVFDIGGVPYAGDVLCTPDIWPYEPGVSVYPVYAEAILLYRMNTCPGTGSNPCQILGWDSDFAAFEYVVRYIDDVSGSPVIDKETGNAAGGIPGYELVHLPLPAGGLVETPDPNSAHAKYSRYCFLIYFQYAGQGWS